MFLLKRCLLVSICLASSAALSKEITTHLDCNVVLNHGATVPQFIQKPDGTRQPLQGQEVTDMPVQFDLVIKDSGNDRLWFNGGSQTGASIGFDTYSSRYKVVSNDSSNSSYRFAFEILQRDGTVFSTEKFSLNRYSGEIEIESRSGPLWGKSKGRCKVLSSKAF